MAAILVEMAFIDNAKDAELLKNKQEQFAINIASGLLSYFGISYKAEVVAEPAPTGQLYRIRKEWANAALQKGAFHNLNNAKKECDKYPGYSVFDEAGKKLYTCGDSKVTTPVVTTPTKQYVNLPASAGYWNVYPVNKAPVIGNQCGKLAPQNYGGLSYEILGKPQTHVYTIQTSSFGKVNIYAGPDTSAKITTSKLY